MYTALLFDLDGTVTDSKVGITKSLQYALQACGVIVDDLATLEKFIGPPLPNTFREHYGFDEQTVQKAVRQYRAYFTKTGITENAVYPGVALLLEHLKKQGNFLALATSKPQPFAEKILNHFQLDHFFDVVQGATLDGTLAEKTDIVSAVLQTIPDVSKAQVVMIGDRKHDIIAARKHHIDSIGVLYGYGSKQELELAEPTYLASTVSALSALLLR